jgi:hypothetical protein
VKSTQIHRDTIGEVTVSTVFVEGNDYEYFETAVIEKGQHRVVDWGISIDNPIEADAVHATWVNTAYKALRYQER